jgi:NAD(P)H-nitrite reductase large subunit
MRITIIGYGPAAVKALEAIEYHVSLDPRIRPHVTVISYERAMPYAPMFLIKYMTGQMAHQHLLLRGPHHSFSFPVREILGKRAVEIRIEEKSVVLDEGQQIAFDQLLIASGASPAVPPVKGFDKKGVHALSRIDDATKISDALKDAREIVIIGAGAMGIEAAIACNALGKKVRVVDLAGQILPQTLGAELAQYVQRQMGIRGIEFYLGSPIAEITGDDRATGALTRNGQEVHGSVILLTAGVRPNLIMARSAGIKIEKGILVDESMRTSIPCVYAAGDVAQSIRNGGVHEPVFTWYSAACQGWVAGCNMVGQEKKDIFHPMLSVLKEIEFPVVSIGKKDEGPYTLFSRRDEKAGVFEKVYLRDDVMDCYQAIGVKDKVGLFYSLITNRKKIAASQRGLFLESFNPSHLIV